MRTVSVEPQACRPIYLSRCGIRRRMAGRSPPELRRTGLEICGIGVSHTTVMGRFVCACTAHVGVLSSQASETSAASANATKTQHNSRLSGSRGLSSICKAAGKAAPTVETVAELDEDTDQAEEDWNTLGPAARSTLGLLEWPRLCEQVAEFASTAVGKRRAKALPVPLSLPETEGLQSEARCVQWWTMVLRVLHGGWGPLLK